MKTYEITAPDGKTYEVQGSGTQEEALAHFKANWQPKEVALKPEQAAVPVGADTATNRVKRAALGAVQGAVLDPLAALGQMLPDQYGGNLANQQLQWYENKRRELGGEGFDPARLGGNVAGAFIPGLGAAGKLAKGRGLVTQGATVGGVTGVLQPVLPMPEETESFWGEKFKQGATGALLGGALNKLIGAGSPALARTFENKGNLPATTEQLAAQSPKALSTADVSRLTPNQKIEYYRQLFPDADLTWGQALGPRANIFEQKAMSYPLVGSTIREARARALESQNVAMMNKALEPAGIALEKGARAGRGLFEEASEKLSKQYDEILNETHLPAPDVLRGKIVGTGKMDTNGNVDLGVVGDRYQTLSESAKDRFNTILENQLFKKFGKGPSGEHSVPMSGQQFKNHEEAIKNSIDHLMQGTGEERIMGKMLKDALDAAYLSLEGKTPEVSKQLKSLNKAYAQYKILENASTASAQSSGVFNPLQTIKAATTGSRAQVAKGKGLLQPEAELSQDVLGRTYPDSGTAGRLAISSPIGLVGGLLSDVAASAAYNPALVRLATGTGTKLGRQFENTRVGSHLARQAPKYVGAATRYSHAPEAQEPDIPYAGGGPVSPLAGWLKEQWAGGGLVDPLASYQKSPLQLIGY